MRPPVYSTSVSFHRLFNAVNITQPIFRECKNQLPFIQPCYSVSDASSRAIISVMRENRIPMICANPRQVSFVDDHSLVIENNRFGTNEYIARNMKDLVSGPAASPRAPAIRHLAELRYYALKETSLINGFTQKKPELRLILGALFDSVGGGGAGDISTRRRRFAAHEYP